MTVSARNYVTAFAGAAVIAVSQSACGGGGNGPTNGPPPTTYVDVDLSGLMSGYSTPQGSFTIRPGQHVDRGDVRLQCAAGGEDCTVMVTVEDGMTTATARSPGGTVTAVDVPPMYVDVDLSGLMSGFSTPEGSFTIRAGQHADRGDVRFQCAAGGEDCTVMVAVEDGTTTATARTSGGTVTAVDVPPPDKKNVDLSDVTVGFLADQIMMLEIDAGESADHGDIRFSCASGGEDCVVMVMVADDGTITAMSSGGEVTASDAGDPNTLVDQSLDDAINAGHSMSMHLPTLGASGAPDAMSGYTEMADATYAEIDGRAPMVFELETPVMGADPAMTGTLVIYSNTDFEIAVDFAEEHTLDTNSDSMGDYQSLIIDSGNVSQVSDVSVFPTTPNTMTNISMNVAGMGLGGKFDGADGEYWCDTVGGCVVSTDADGNLSGVTGDLYFTPDGGVTVDVPNPDYIYFGYWLEESEDGNGDPAFEIAGVYGGPAPSNDSDVVNLEGEATYEGSATGVYVRRWTDANTEVLRRRTGQFTADAELTAYFGGDTVRAVDHYSISGTIGNFMTSGRAIDASWSLALQRADFSSSSFDGTTQGTGNDGMWYGQFFGEVEVDNDLQTNGNQSTLPSGVAGTFDGHFNNGDVIGAYGAERDD